VFWGAFSARDPKHARANIATLVEWWQTGRLHPHVSAVYPLERAGEALRELADRRAEGKVVVAVQAD
jgi:NADPH2:quinone reductase